MLVIVLAARWASIPLMIAMAVAMISVHWQAIADTKFCLSNCGDAQEAAERLSAAKKYFNNMVIMIG